MADIELVIKIPEEMYTQIINKNGIDTILIPYKDIIRNGTPLPKGHGRLIDADWLKNAIHNFFYGLNRAVEEEDIQRYIDVARTRVEADKGDKE